MKINLDLMARIRLAYLLATGLLITVVISAFVLVNNGIHNRENDAVLINLVSQQRMWSQRILLLTTRLANPVTVEDIADSRAQLKDAFTAIASNHTRVHAVLQQTKVQSVFPEIYRLYYAGLEPLTLNEQLQTYLADAKRISNLKDAQQIARELAPDGDLRVKARKLLQRYQTILEQIVSTSRDRVHDVQVLHSLLTLITVVLALALVIWLFRPMEKLIHAERENQRSLNINLEQLVKQRADELMNSELRAQSVLNTVLDGIVTINNHGLIQSFNPAAEKLFGYTSAEVQGRNVNILMPETYHSEHDGYPQHYADSGQARIIGIGREVSGRRQDGSTFPMELAVNEIDRGKGHGYVGMVRDLTLRKAAEAKLQAVISMRQAILDSANFSIIATNTEGLISIFNSAAQRMLGYTREEVIGQCTPAIIHLESEVVARAKILSLELGTTIEPGFEVFVVKTRSGLPDENEWTYVRKDGTTLPVLLSVTALFDASGVITGFLGIAYDMTERKRMELMKREFISTVSHELRTPLTSIRGALGLVAGGATGALPDKALELINIASNNCDRLVRLINDILDMEKIESGKMVFDTQPFDLPAMLRETIIANQAYATQHQSTIVVAGELPSLELVGDRDRLIQVFTNLLSNAAKFSPKNGEIHVSLKQHDNHARITVRDAGPGISKDFQSRLFQKFSQQDSSDTRSKNGTGLGLSITKAIIERHGGHISYTTADGQGTAFFVDLPLANTVTVTPSKTGPRILVVEDDSDIADLLRMILEQHDYTADIALNAREARAHMALHHYAALTLDMLLPDENGIEFLRALRKHPATAALPVIVVSAVAEASRKHAENTVVSVLDWLEKPIDEKRLLRAVAQAVNHGTRKGQRVLHVEDDPDITRIVKTMLEGVADIETASTLAAARACLAQGDYALVILDIGLPDGSGLELLPALNNVHPPIPIVVFSALELNEKERSQVTASFVKSRTHEASLVQAIRTSLQAAIAELKHSEPGDIDNTETRTPS